MQTFGKSPRTGVLLVVISACLLQGCAVAAVGTVAAVGGLGYGLSKEQPESTASAVPATAGEPHPRDRSTQAAEPSEGGELVVLVEPQAPVESVEVEPIQ